MIEEGLGRALVVQWKLVCALPAFQLPIDPLVDFLAVHGNVFRGFDPETHLIAIDA